MQFNKATFCWLARGVRGCFHQAFFDSCCVHEGPNGRDRVYGANEGKAKLRKTKAIERNRERERWREFELKFQKLNPSRHFCCLFCSFTVDSNKRQQNFNEIFALYDIVCVYVCVYRHLQREPLL